VPPATAITLTNAAGHIHLANVRVSGQKCTSGLLGIALETVH
jgi:hypothetical protein